MTPELEQQERLDVEHDEVKMAELIVRLNALKNYCQFRTGKYQKMHNDIKILIEKIIIHTVN